MRRFLIFLAFISLAFISCDKKVSKSSAKKSSPSPPSLSLSPPHFFSSIENSISEESVYPDKDISCKFVKAYIQEQLKEREYTFSSDYVLKMNFKKGEEFVPILLREEPLSTFSFRFIERFLKYRYTFQDKFTLRHDVVYRKESKFYSICDVMPEDEKECKISSYYNSPEGFGVEEDPLPFNEQVFTRSQFKFTKIKGDSFFFSISVAGKTLPLTCLK